MYTYFLFYEESTDNPKVHTVVLLTALLDRNRIQSNIVGLVDSGLVRYHTVVDP